MAAWLHSAWHSTCNQPPASPACRSICNAVITLLQLHIPSAAAHAPGDIVHTKTIRNRHTPVTHTSITTAITTTINNTVTALIQKVRDRLVAACSRVGVRFVYSASVEELRPPAQQGSEALQEAVQDAGRPAQWTVTLANGARVRAARIVMCTGGRSFPAVGTDGTGTRLLASLGHTVTPEFAALTPIKGRHPGGHQLAGE